MLSSRWRRLAAAVFVSAAVVAMPVPAQAATPTTDAADAAAGYLARQFVNGDHLESFDFPDAGLTIDAVLAFAAAGVSGDAANKAVAFLSKPDTLSGYLGDGTNEAYAGATAKAAYLAEVLGQNPASFGGVDLVARLKARMDTTTGQFKDKSQYGDFSNVFGQSFAILALAGLPGGPAVPPLAVQFLVGKQCADGGFAQLYTGPCTSEVDRTAMAVQALLAAGETQSAAKGLDFLVGYVNNGPKQSNSAGLVAQTLRVAGKTTEADKAVAFIRTLQVDCAGPEADRGGIAADPADPNNPASGFQSATAPRATAQAILGLVGTGFAKLSIKDIAADAPTLDCPVAAAPLPNTGTSVTSVVLVASGLLVVGIALVFIARSRRRVA